MPKTAITITFDTDALSSYTDTFLAQLWHVGQANPAPITDHQAGEIAEAVGREIIRRWLEREQPELWAHQGRHAYSCILSDNGHWPGPTHDRWVFGKPEETRAEVESRAGRDFAAAVRSPGRMCSDAEGEAAIAILNSASIPESQMS